MDITELKSILLSLQMLVHSYQSDVGIASTARASKEAICFKDHNDAIRSRFMPPSPLKRFLSRPKTADQPFSAASESRSSKHWEH